MNELKIAPDVAAPPAIPFRVRLEPYLIESICELSRVIREKASPQTDVSGLLYGSADKGSRIVAALKTFQDAGPRSDLARRERLEKAYIAAVDEANEDPELASLQLIGWFSFRNGSGLLSSDVVFHNQHFRKPEDLAVVVWREGNAQITAEVYSKSGPAAMTSTDYRWSSVRLSSEIRHMSEPIDLAMRVKLNDDSFLRAYDSEPEEPESVFEGLKKRTSASVVKFFSFLQVRPKEEVYSARVRGLLGDGRLPAQGWDTPPAGPEEVPDVPSFKEEWRRFEMPPTGRSSALNEVTSMPPGKLSGNGEPGRSVAAAAASGAVFGAPRPMPEPQRPASHLPPVPVLDLGRIGQMPQRARSAQTEVGGLPMVIRPQKKRFPWQWAAVLFVVCSAAVFALFAFTGLQGGNGPVAQMMRSLFRGTDLNLNVHSEDDHMRLSWNPRNPAVASATDAILQIMDGPQQRNFHLKGSEVSIGSILYRPMTSDVTFRLEVHGEQGSAVSSVRVLDGPPGRESPVLDMRDPQSNTSGETASAQLPGATDPYAADPGHLADKTDPNAPVILRRGSSGSEEVPVPVPYNSPTTASKGTIGLPAASLVPDPNSVAAAYPSRNDGSITNDRQVQAPSPLNDPSVRTPLAPVNNKVTPGFSGTAINGWDTTPEPSPKKRRASIPGTSTGTTATTVSDFVAPQPLMQVTPNTRSLANGAVQAPTRVEVQVRVDITGHVAYARVLNGANLKRAVSSAALNAARQWTFQPATLHGQRVESDHTIVFEFRPQH